MGFGLNLLGGLAGAAEGGMKGYEWMQKQKLAENEDRRQEREHQLRLEQLRQHLEDSGLLRKEKGREEAIANFRLTEGTDPRDAPFTSIEGPGGGPAEVPITEEASRPQRQFNAQTGQTDTIPEVGAGNRFRPVPIPNVYSEGNTQIRPRSRDEMDTERVRLADEKANQVEYNLGPGEKRFRGQKEIASGGPREEPTVTVRTVDERGRPVTKVLPRSQAVGQSFPAQPRANAAGGMFGSAGPTIDAAAASGQAMGDDALKGLTPQMQNLVKQIVDYKRPIPSGIALTRGDWPKILLIAHAYDPAFDENQYTNRQKLRADMLSGKSANNIKSFNTAIRHLQTLQKAGEALKNFSFQPANAVYNYVAEKGGSPEPTNFLAAANALAAEAATAFKGTAGTDQEIKAWRESLSANMSPEQIHGAVKTITELLAGRISETNDTYQRGMGKPKDFHFLSDASRTILTTLGVDVDTIDPGGASAPSQGTGGRGVLPPLKSGGETTWTRDANGKLVKVGG